MARCPIIEVISGGQTGADFAGIRAAARRNIQTFGWVPKGWRTDAGANPKLSEYNLREHHSPEYPPRTEANVIEAEATLIFGRSSPGTNLTEKLCLKHQRDFRRYPFPTSLSDKDTIKEIRDWIRKENISSLNIAGNRESKNRGIYAYVYNLLSAVFEHNW